MYDYNKADIIKTPIELFSNNTLLEFIIDCNIKTGELKEHIQIAEYKELEFTIIQKKYLNVKGSFHKYWNTENTNFNDYSINDFYLTLNELNQKFDINPFNALIHNIEFGVNVILPFRTQTFLNSIIAFKGKEYKKARRKFYTEAGVMFDARAIANEFGTANMSAKPYLRVSLESQAQAVAAKLGMIIKQKMDAYKAKKLTT